MTRPLHHDLYAGIMRAPHQLSQRHQLFHLCTVCGIGQAPGTHAVAEAQRHVVFAGDIKQAIKVFVERVLPVIMQHPTYHEGAPAGDDIGDPSLLFEPGNGRPCHTAVHGDKIDAVAAAILNSVKDVIDAHLYDSPTLFDRLDARLVNRHRADRQSAGRENRPPDSGYIAAGAQIHHRIRPGIRGDAQLLEFGRHVAVIGRGADIGVDLDR